MKLIFHIPRIILLFAAVGFIVTGCSDQPDSPEAYAQWFVTPENGFLKERVIKDLRFKVAYRPSMLMAYRELDEDDQINKNILDSLSQTYDQGHYFILEVGPNREFEANSGDLIKNYSQDHNSYQKNIRNLAFSMKENVQLVLNTDTVQPVLYHYEQGYELTSSQRFIFAFPQLEKSPDQNMTFIFDDLFFGGGRLKFRFDIDENKMPQFPIDQTS